MSSPLRRLGSVCVFCGSSQAAPPAYLSAAARFGATLAEEGVRMVYGGGGVGLMGACASAAQAGGGQVLGVIPKFLVSREIMLDTIETVVVTSMHERKLRMFDEADAFAVLPGAIGTLEEAIELSWRRLGLHAKPIAFYNPDGFWDPLFDLFARFTQSRLLPDEFSSCWRAVAEIEGLLPALRSIPVDDAIVVPMLQRA